MDDLLAQIKCKQEIVVDKALRTKLSTMIGVRHHFYLIDDDGGQKESPPTGILLLLYKKVKLVFNSICFRYCCWQSIHNSNYSQATSADQHHNPVSQAIPISDESFAVVWKRAEA